MKILLALPLQFLLYFPTASAQAALAFLCELFKLPLWSLQTVHKTSLRPLLNKETTKPLDKTSARGSSNKTTRWVEFQITQSSLKRAPLDKANASEQHFDPKARSLKKPKYRCSIVGCCGLLPGKTTRSFLKRLMKHRKGGKGAGERERGGGISVLDTQV